MRLGWSKKGNSVSYYVHKTIYVDGKNKSLVIKRFGSEKYICESKWRKEYEKNPCNATGDCLVGR